MCNIRLICCHILTIYNKAKVSFEKRMQVKDDPNKLIQKQNHSQSGCKLQQRNIETSLHYLRQISARKKGKPKETSNLSKYVYGQIMELLRSLRITNCLNSEQIEAVQSFKKGRGRLDSYQNLFTHPKIQKRCQQLIQTSSFVKKIFISERMNLINKITILRLIERIRDHCIFPMHGWKKKSN